MTDARTRLGIVFGSLTPPEQLAEGAALAERLGFAELWFSEDCFFTGGVSGLTQLLASTRTMPAGLGLASVMTRHPAVLAMELAGLARMHPGRVRATVGLGNRHWLEQMGLLPDRPLSAITDTFAALRSLLAGDPVDRDTSAHELHGIQLAFPPMHPPELWIGAVNPRALRAAGALADGVLLSVLSGPAYIRWAAEQVAAGAAEAGRPAPPITAFVLASVAANDGTARDAVRDAVRFFLAAEAHSALVGRSSHGEEVRRRVAGGARGTELVVEDAWIDEFAVAGDARRVAASLEALRRAGADSLGLWLFPADRLHDQLERLAAVALDWPRRVAFPGGATAASATSSGGGS
jgi:alkanesulfonate monooxygenase SsuD/methylene tetrahydromethanopterin reductase-like flavin-dependent oxidoreductase (luciferase family)